MPEKFTLKVVVLRGLLYIGLALGALTVIFLAVVVSARTRTIIPVRWWMLATFTGVLIYSMVKTNTRYWKRPAFWAIGTGFLIVHCAVFVRVLNSVQPFPALWFVPIVIAEAGAFGVVASLLLESRRTR